MEKSTIKTYEEYSRIILKSIGRMANKPISKTPELANYLQYIEVILTKYLIGSNTIAQLHRGTLIGLGRKGSGNMVQDISSILTLCRTQIETFALLDYMLFSVTDLHEGNFRFRLNEFHDLIQYKSAMASLKRNLTKEDSSRIKGLKDELLASFNLLLVNHPLQSKIRSGIEQENLNIGTLKSIEEMIGDANLGDSVLLDEFISGNRLIKRDSMGNNMFLYAYQAPQNLNQLEEKAIESMNLLNAKLILSLGRIHPSCAELIEELEPSIGSKLNEHAGLSERAYHRVAC